MNLSIALIKLPIDKKMFSHKKKYMRCYFLLFVYLISIFLLSACGIDSYPFLSPPEASSIHEPLEAGTSFEFANYTENNSTYFQGYELFYKFYSSDSFNLTDPFPDSYNEDIAVIEKESETSVIAKLGLLGFHRFFSFDQESMPGDDSLPLLKVDSSYRDIDFRVTIEFGYIDSLNLYPIVSYNNKNIEICRYVNISESDVKYPLSFLPEHFSETYSDIPAGLISSSDQSIYLAIVVLTYGQYDIIYDLYSKAAALGAIRLNIN